MKTITKIVYCFLCIMLLCLSFCACEQNDKSESEVSAQQSEKSESDYLPSAEALKTELCGEWGRLDEPMHYFYEDMTCVIGGMKGTYEINAARKLILTTESGAKTEYDWAQSRGDTQSNNYWYLKDDVIKINGNQFTKIIEADTPDHAAE
ncbi:MAG: hypothetical protein VZR27_01720 [Acutalibacteraceae bacterium]|nr:hypothetical protein [Clostridia bacterium]MEE3449408.1 hypothetical protein [Acutalibacteraceae bacterium]